MRSRISVVEKMVAVFLSDIHVFNDNLCECSGRTKKEKRYKHGFPCSRRPSFTTPITRAPHEENGE